MAGNGDPGEDTPTVTLVDAAEVASAWANVGTQLDGMGHQVAALKASGVDFPEKVTAAMFGIGQGCTSVAAQWTTAAGDAQKQHDEVDVPKSADYKTKTETLKQAKAMSALMTSQANAGRVSPVMAASAKASEATARAERLKVLDDAVTDTTSRVQPLPGHGRLAGEAVQTARGTMVTQLSSGQTLAPVEQVKPPTSPSNNSRANKPASNTLSSPSKPSSPNKPSDNKNAVDDKGSEKGQTPQSQSPQQGQQPQQGQGQGGQPQQGQPQSGAPASGQPSSQQRSPGVLPVSTPTPARGVDPSGKGGPSVRPTAPSAPVPTPAQRAGVEGRTAPLGSGNNATGGGAASSANKSGGIGSGTGASPASTGSSARPMGGGMMGGAGAHGAGAGGQARPKGEVKADPKDKVLRGEHVAEQALGGIIRDGDTGAPITPPAPGSNGGAPVPPPRPGS